MGDGAALGNTNRVHGHPAPGGRLMTADVLGDEWCLAKISMSAYSLKHQILKLVKNPSQI